MIVRSNSPPEPVQLYAHNEFFDCTWHKPNLNINLKTKEYDVIFKTNSIGLRESNELVKKNDENEIRIMNLGDSFIQAAQVNDKNTMSSKLEYLFNSKQSNGGVTVFNVGTSGCNPNFHKNFLKKNINKFELDYLFYFPYIGNDILTLSSIREIKQTKTEEFLNVFGQMIRKHSKLVNYVYLRVPGLSEAEMQGPMGRPSQPFDGEREQESANIFLKSDNSYIRDAYKKFWRDLDEIIEICNEADIRLFVFVVPTKEQVDSESLIETLSFFQIDEESIDLKKPQKLIESYLLDREINYYDLTDTLMNANSNNKTYFDFDSHWNIHGNDVVAKYIFHNTKNLILDNN